LGEVEIKLVRNGSPDERPGITLVFADQAVEKNKAEPWVPMVKRLDRSDHMPDAFSLLVDSAITEDFEFPTRLSSHLSFREWGRRFRLRQTKKYLRVNPARRPETQHLIFSLYPPADAFGIAEEMIVAAGNILLLFVALEDEIEEFLFSLKAVELREDGIFTADSDLEFLGRDRSKRFDLPPEFQPIGLPPCWSE